MPGRATTIRLDARTKRELDRVQSVLQSKGGRRMTHAEVLRELLRFARDHEFGAADAMEPWTEAEWRAWVGHLRRRGRGSGSRVSAKDLDRVLYGDEP